MKKDMVKKKIEQDLKEIFRKQADPVAPERLDSIRRRVLAGIPEGTSVPAFPRFPRPTLALASGLAVVVIAVGIYLSREQSPPLPPDTVSRRSLGDVSGHRREKRTLGNRPAGGNTEHAL